MKYQLTGKLTVMYDSLYVISRNSKNQVLYFDLSLCSDSEKILSELRLYVNRYVTVFFKHTLDDIVMGRPDLQEVYGSGAVILRWKLV